MKTVPMMALIALLLPLAASAQLVNGQFIAPYDYIDANTRVAQGWTHFRLLQQPQFKQSDFEQMPGGPGGQVSCQQIWADWSSFDAGVYQVISGLTPGQTYRATGWFLSIYQHGVTFPTKQDGNIYQRIGIDPTGGTDPNSSNVVWSWDDPLDRLWREIQVTATAQGASVTLFARTRNLYAATNCLSFYDAFGFSAVNPVLVTDVKARPGSGSVTITWNTDVPATSKVGYVPYRATGHGYTDVTDTTPKTQHSVTIDGLAQNQQYYYTLTSTAAGRNDGVSGGHSFTTLGGTPYASLVEARKAADNTRVFLQNMLVTAGTNQSNSYIFLRQLDGASAIRCDRPAMISLLPGSVVDVSGILSTSLGERRLTDPWFYLVRTGEPVVPLGLGNASVGGSDFDALNTGVTDSIGPFNMGQLVRVWGRITVHNLSTKYLCLDDGSGLSTGLVSGVKGVRVSWASMSGLGIAPVTGKYACVTGMVSCLNIGGETYPVILLRTRNDFQQF